MYYVGNAVFIKKKRVNTKFLVGIKIGKRVFVSENILFCIIFNKEKIITFTSC